MEEKGCCSPSEPIKIAGLSPDESFCEGECTGRNGISVETDQANARIVIALVVNGQKIGCSLTSTEAGALNQAINACIFEAQTFEKI